MANQNLDTADKGSYVGKKEYYQKYPYRCWDVTLLQKNIVPTPYVPIKDVICDHKYSLTYKEYSEIFKVYTKYVLEALCNGAMLRLPHNIGTIQLKRYKAKQKIYTKGEPLVERYNLVTRGFRPILKWDRSAKVARLRFKWHWKINFLKPTWGRVTKFLEQDTSRILNIEET